MPCSIWRRSRFREDLDLEKLMEQGDALLEIAPLVSSEREETTMPDSPTEELYLIVLSISS